MGASIATVQVQIPVQEQFDEAARLRVSPCAWIPPTWKELNDYKNGNKFLDTPPDLPFFDNVAAARERITQGQKIDQEPVDSPEATPGTEPFRKKAWVNPFANFDHVDDSEFSNSDVTLIAGELPDGNASYPRLKTGADLLEKHRGVVLADLGQNENAKKRFAEMLDLLKGILPGESQAFAAVKQDLEHGPIFSALTRAITDEKEHKALDELKSTLGSGANTLTQLNAVNRLRRIVGESTPGMKRLERIFEWALYRTTELLSDLNFARKKNEAAYAQARDNYIAFLNDLDDHEPDKGTQKLDPRGEPVGARMRKSGYGMAIKWNCIHPVIKDGDIIGARVIIQWNPHSSSNGQPINH